MSGERTRPLPMVGESNDGRIMHYSVGAIIRDENKRILMLDRMYEPYGFACPAGHVDEGETPLEAMLREAREEIRAQLRDLRLVCEQEIPWNHCRNDGINRVDVHYWRLYRAIVRSSDVVVDPHEAKRFEWFTPAEITCGYYTRNGILRSLTIEDVWRHWFLWTGMNPS